MDNLEIIPLQPAHLEEATQIHQQYLSPSWSLANFKETLECSRSCGFAAFIDKRIIGFIIGRTIDCEAEILTLVVSLQWQKCGIGNNLVRILLDTIRLRGGDRVFIEVNANNQIARKLYNKFDFRVISERPNYYPPIPGFSRTALVLEKIFL